MPEYKHANDPEKKDDALTKLVPFLQYCALAGLPDLSAELAQYAGKDLATAFEGGPEPPCAPRSDTRQRLACCERREAGGASRLWQAAIAAARRRRRGGPAREHDLGSDAAAEGAIALEGGGRRAGRGGGGRGAGACQQGFEARARSAYYVRDNYMDIAIGVPCCWGAGMIYNYSMC